MYTDLSSYTPISFYIHTYIALFVTIACDPRAIACGTLVPAPNLLAQGLVPGLSVPRAVFSESATVAKSTTSRTRALIAAKFCTASPPQSSCCNQHKLKWSITDQAFVKSFSLWAVAVRSFQYFRRQPSDPSMRPANSSAKNWDGRLLRWLPRAVAEPAAHLPSSCRSCDLSSYLPVCCLQ